MTKDELIKLYISKVQSSTDPKKEIINIIQEINNLTYENSTKNISISDKLELLKKLKHHFELLEESAEFSKSFSKEREIICSATDNSEIIKMLDRAEGRLRG